MSKKIFLVVLILLVSCPLIAIAQPQGDDGPYPSEAWSLQDIIDLVGTIRDFFLIVGIVLIVIFLIWTGISFLSAQGNPEKIQQAKTRLTWTLVGATVILATYTILSTIRGFIEKNWI